MANIQAIFSSIRVSDFDTLATMTEVRKTDNFALCPHSAIGVFGARLLTREASLWSSRNPMVCVLTAHASKFSETYNDATGEAAPICPWSNVEDLRAREQRFEWLRKDTESSKEWQAAWIKTLKESVTTRTGSQRK